MTFLSSLVQRTRDRALFTHLSSTTCGFTTISFESYHMRLIIQSELLY